MQFTPPTCLLPRWLGTATSPLLLLLALLLAMSQVQPAQMELPEEEADLRIKALVELDQPLIDDLIDAFPPNREIHIKLGEKDLLAGEKLLLLDLDHHNINKIIKPYTPEIRNNTAAAQSMVWPPPANLAPNPNSIAASGPNDKAPLPKGPGEAVSTAAALPVGQGKQAQAEKKPNHTSVTVTITKIASVNNAAQSSHITIQSSANATKANNVNADNQKPNPASKTPTAQSKGLAASKTATNSTRSSTSTSKSAIRPTRATPTNNMIHSRKINMATVQKYSSFIIEVNDLVRKQSNSGDMQAVSIELIFVPLIFTIFSLILF